MSSAYKAWMWLVVLWSVALITWGTIGIVHSVLYPRPEIQSTAALRYEACMERTPGDNNGPYCAKLAGVKP